ncbi:MAG: glycoside hydrolase family 38 C-terminal domain-containing protein, partial [Victivallaceae bacterium]
NRKCENLLVSAEIFASIASLSGFAYPHKELNDAWEKTCFNQFHDIMDGSAIHSSYEYSKDLAESAINTARQAQQEALTHISSRIAFPERNGGTPLVIFNPLAWKRSETAKISLSGLKISNPAVEDIYGREIPSQIVGGELFFHAENVPSMGYKSYFLKEGLAEARPGEKSEPETETVFENDKYLLEMDPDFGGIKRLFDKEKRKELIDCLQQGNIFRLYTEVEHSMSAWNIGATASVKNLYRHTKFTKVDRGSLVDILETECKFNQSLLKQRIIFFRKCGKIEFQTELSWNETGNPQDGIPMLRVSFPLKFNPEKIVREIPFGAFEHPCNGQEVPALKWIDCSDGGNGVALLNDCKYGFNVRGSDMELTIVRSPYSPDLNPDYGEHSFSYCLCPHDGDWRDADIVKKGYEFNIPLLAVIPAGLAESGANLPSEKSFVKSAGTDGVIISCLKKAEDGNGLIMHAYESKGKSAAPEINFGINIAAVRETNLIEDETGSGEFTGSKLRDKFGEWEIKSYRLIPE